MPQDETVTASTPAGAGAGNATTRPTSATGGGAGGESGSGGPVQGQPRTGPAKDCDAAKDWMPQAGRAAGPGGAAVSGATSRFFVFGASRGSRFGGGSGGSGGSSGAVQGQADAAKKTKPHSSAKPGPGTEAYSREASWSLKGNRVCKQPAGHPKIAAQAAFHLSIRAQGLPAVGGGGLADEAGPTNVYYFKTQSVIISKLKLVSSRTQLDEIELH